MTSARPHEFTEQEVKDYVLWQIQQEHGVPYTGNGHHNQDRGYSLNDKGNGKRFADKFHDEYRYVPELDLWLRWNGIRWEPDIGGLRVRQAAKRIAVDVFIEAGHIPDGQQYDKARTAWCGWAKQSGQGHHVLQTLKMAQSEPGMAVRVEELDADPLLLNFPNGTLNLTTDDFYPARRGDLITKVAGARYVAEATHALWDGTLEYFVPDAAMQRDLQTAYGYSVHGRAKEHVFLKLGKTRTGKSTIANTCKNALGDYATDSDFETFASSKNGRAATGRGGGKQRECPAERRSTQAGDGGWTGSVSAPTTASNLPPCRRSRCGFSATMTRM
jgi:putative DNA primase/helicase